MKVKEEAIYTCYYVSPVGRIEISATESHIVSVMFADAAKRPGPNLPATAVNSVIEFCINELEAYFSGTLQVFSVPFLLNGTTFQKGVWEELVKIPYGKKITYGEQAKRLKNEKAIRAVGTCNGSNKISIIVPCHRVIGANGSLTGYAGDLWVKKWLLEHEQKHSGTFSEQMSIF